MKTVYDLSVIVPVFNAERHLKEMLGCLSCQTFDNFEVIFVDDGSTDKTKEIIENYKYSRKNCSLIVLYENHGAGYARNRGLEYASGKYLLFVDADDIFDENFLGEMYSTAEENQADIAVCEWDQFCGHYVKDSRMPGKTVPTFMTKVFSIKDIDLTSALSMSSAMWLYLFNRRFVDNHKVRFQELKSSNDVYFVEILKRYAESIVHTKSGLPLYHQRLHNTPGRISNNRNPFDTYEAVIKLNKEFKNVKDRDDLMPYHVADTFRNLFFAVNDSKNRKIQEEFIYFLRTRGFEELDVKSMVYDNQKIKERLKLCYKIMERGTVEDVLNIDDKLQEFDKIRYESRIKILIEKINSHSVAIWGVGTRWSKIYRLFDDMGVDYVLIDQFKGGSTFDGNDIYTYDKLSSTPEYILITNMGYIQEIYEIIKCKETKVFDLWSFINSSRSFEECLFCAGDACNA